MGLSLMRALLLYKSISCLVFMCLPLPMGLSGPATRSSACLTLCGVDESLGFHSLYLVSSLGWVLLRYGPFSLIQPLSPLLSVYRLTGAPTTPLHCFCHDIV